MSDMKKYNNDYRFPVLGSIDNLKKIVAKAKSEIKLEKKNLTGKVKKKEYDEIRSEHCAANIQRNFIGVRAPAFRSGRKARPAHIFKKGEEYPDYELSNDRQVIDLHWLFLHHKNEIDTSDEDFGALYERDDFDFELASEIVNKKGGGKLKANILGLSSDTQLEMATIHEPSIRKFKKQVLGVERKEAIKRIRNKGKQLDKEGANKWANMYVALRLSLGVISHGKILFGFIEGQEPMSGVSTLLSNSRKTLQDVYVGIEREDWSSLENPFKKPKT